MCCGVAIASPAARGTSSAVKREATRHYKAVAFDYLVLFNPDSVISAIERVVPEPIRVREFLSLWRTRQFEYSWLRSITNRYVDFSCVTEDALTFTAEAMRVTLTASQKQQLLNAYLHLTPWLDTVDALRTLREARIQVITIANFSPAMLSANAQNARLTSLFDALISTDANHTYKPDPRAYRLGVDRLGLRKQEVVFAAFGSWDAAGAKSFGYPTVWVNRLNQPPERLGVNADQTVTDLHGLLQFVLRSQPAS
jgi:2-haloacid dehalogenase